MCSAPTGGFYLFLFNPRTMTEAPVSVSALLWGCFPPRLHGILCTALWFPAGLEPPVPSPGPPPTPSCCKKRQEGALKIAIVVLSHCLKSLIMPAHCFSDVPIKTGPSLAQLRSGAAHSPSHSLSSHIAFQFFQPLEPSSPATYPPVSPSGTSSLAATPPSPPHSQGPLQAQ